VQQHIRTLRNSLSFVKAKRSADFGIDNAKKVKADVLGHVSLTISCSIRMIFCSDSGECFDLVAVSIKIGAAI